MKIPSIISKSLINYYRFIIGGVVAIVLVAGYILILSPKVTQIRSSDVTAKQNAESELAVQKKYVEALRASNEKFTKVLPENTQASINTFIPSDPDFPGLMLTVKNIVSEAQLTLDSITVGASGQQAASGATATTGGSTKTPTANAATVSGVSLSTQDVSITVSGGNSYESFKRLLTAIESSQRLFDVVSVSFSVPTQQSTSTTTATSAAAVGTTWSLVLRSYYLPTK